MNAVNAVKDQGQCGSCWAFSTIASIEGSYSVLSSALELYSLSEQQLLDCDHEDNACNGGNPVLAYAYFEAHTTMQEADYPYLASDGHLCSYKEAKGVVQVTDYTRVTAGSASQLKAAIQKQPVSVAVEADHTIFNQYTGGIIDSDECGTNLDHAVNAVGYGSEGGKDYYIIRNSWGADWGESGYLRIAATEDGDGVCGV